MQRVQTLIELLRIGLDCKEKSDLLLGELSEAMRIASAHGLSAIAFDGLEKASNSNLELQNETPKPLLLQWYGQSVHQTALFKKNWSAACSLSSLWGEHGIEAVVLKGRSIAQYYPIPEHRYSCDLDLFVAGDDWVRACEILEAKGIRLEREVYKEVEFTFEGVNVELHRYITPVRGNKTLLRFERYLRNVLKASSKTYFERTKLVCPPLMFTVMLYIEHALGDILHGKLTLKHVVDWVVLRKLEIDRTEIEARCKEFGFEKFLGLIDSLADVVFCLFNFRPRGKAKCFAGDVGSIGIAFIILFMIGQLIMKTGDVTYLIFLLVYGVDGCLTICHRIMLHENLGEAHRKHVYQLMPNELKIPHVVVSTIYMVLQLAVSLIAIYVIPDTVAAHWIYLIFSGVVMAVAYILFKP